MAFAAPTRIAIQIDSLINVVCLKYLVVLGGRQKGFSLDLVVGGRAFLDPIEGAGAVPVINLSDGDLPVTVSSDDSAVEDVAQRR